MSLNDKSKSVYLIGLVLLLFLSCNEGADMDSITNLNRDSTLFSKVSSDHSKITFQNILTEGPNTNILMYEYFYNGGGVAVGDFNNDELLDLYFTSNMGSNEFYLNKGGLQFEDITTVSGASGRAGPWKTGVSTVDINGDGLLDLYVCYSGAMPAIKRKNELFVNLGNDNNGIPQFKESAEVYGIASSAHSTQAYFLDHDRDGDLDMILLNHNPKNLPVLNEVKAKALLREDDPMHGVRFYVNDNDFFRDVTVQSNISSSALTYGLGVGVGDFNNDGWPDFYVSNDYAAPDYLYQNNGDGTFENVLTSAIGHVSQFSMGNDVSDVNNDGYLDIVTLDMLPEDNKRQKLLISSDDYTKFDLNVRSGFHYQYMRNMLQLNNGNGTYSEIGNYAGISATDWSWSALLADYNNDGQKDLYVTNGYKRDYTNQDFINYMNDFVQKKGRLKREDVLELVNNMPSSNVSNYMYKGGSATQFGDVTEEWGLKHASNSNGAAYADLDNDGDLDIVVNNINKEAFIFENRSIERSNSNYLQVELNGNGKNSRGLGANVKLFMADQVQVLEQYTSRGYQSSVSSVLQFGIGENQAIDSLHIIWPTGEFESVEHPSINNRIVLSQSDANDPVIDNTKQDNSIFKKLEPPIEYAHTGITIRDFDRQNLLLSEISDQGPRLVAGDLNGDGMEDIFVGGAAGSPAQIFIQKANGKFAKHNSPTFLSDANAEDVDAVLKDLNGDGYIDIYVASGGYNNFKTNDLLLQDRVYLNDGSGNFKKEDNALPALLSVSTCIAPYDINNDGYVDLFIGGGVIPGRFPESYKSTILLNDGTGKLEDVTATLAPELDQVGMVTDAIWSDCDMDGSPELVIVGQWMPIEIFSYDGAELKKSSTTFFETDQSGLWNTIESADLNADGIPDFILGNMGANVHMKASAEREAALFYADFDNNGSIDPIISYYTGEDTYPMLTRDELKKQLASKSSKFTSYESFATASITDIFTERELGNAKKLKINNLNSSILLSSSSGKFNIASLPPEAQYAPIYSILVMDYNKDGNMDLLLCGNNSKMKLRMGKSDANYGVLLKGNGKGELEYVNQMKSGLRLKGDVRSVIRLKNTLLFGINRKAVEAYSL